MVPQVQAAAARVPVWAVLAGGCLLFAGLSLWAMAGESCTYDEAAHLAGGASYIGLRDFRMMPEHPPLSKLFAALPLAALGVDLPDDRQSWSTQSVFDYGFKYLYQGNRRPEQILFWGRVPTLFWSLVLVLSVYAVASERFGPRLGLVSFGLAVLCPTFLAHGHLVTNDMELAALFFLTVVAFQRFLDRPTPARALMAGILLAGAILTKFTALLLLPILVCQAVLAGVQRRESTGADAAPPRFPWGLRLAAGGVLFAAAVMIVIWACYGFRFKGSPDPTFRFSWSFERFNAGSLAGAVYFVRDHALLPEAFLNGFAAVSESISRRDCYALGMHSDQGWWWYFPFAVLVKTPIPSLILFGWGLAAALQRMRSGRPVDTWLLLPLIIFGVLALRSTLNIGIRHIMPALPWLMVLAAGIADRPGRELRAVGALLATTAAGVLLSAPYFLAYFNLPSRIIARPEVLLTDSNLDWGQDLGRLRKYMDDRGLKSIKMAYHGSSSPRALGLNHEVLPGLTWYTQYLHHEKEWKEAGPLQPGDVVAVSATSLVGLVLSDKDFYLRQFGRLEPEAVIGGSILVYRIPPAR